MTENLATVFFLGIFLKTLTKNRVDGRKYEGEWVNGMQHGKGIFVNKFGERLEGLWKNGKREKWIKGPNTKSYLGKNWSGHIKYTY